MIIFPHLEENGTLLLNAYSFRKKELDAISKTLRAVGILFPESEKLIPDSTQRPGRRYTVAKNDVSKVERHLRVKFDNSKESARTVTKFFG